MTLGAIWYRLYNFKKCEKHPWRSATFNNVAKPETFPVKFAKFLRTPFYKTPPAAAFV